jgi:hypothetical protein
MEDPAFGESSENEGFIGKLHKDLRFEVCGTGYLPAIFEKFYRLKIVPLQPKSWAADIKKILLRGHAPGHLALGPGA